MTKLRTVFFGSPEFAVPSLLVLAEHTHVVGVVCQPDRPSGRGLALTPPAVKVAAAELGLPVLQPTKMRDGVLAAWLAEQAVDVALVVAYGRILPRPVLDAPRFGCVNVHASLLPKYRGAAPIQWAVANGETESGITLMKLDEGMDTGPTFAARTLSIGPEETAAELSVRLSHLGATAVAEELLPFVAGERPLRPQDDALSTLAPVLEKADGRVDFSRPADAIAARVRGMTPWPGSFALLGGRALKIRKVRALPALVHDCRPGTVLLADKGGVVVAAATGAVELLEVSPEGKKPMSGASYALGRGIAVGNVFDPA